MAIKVDDTNRTVVSVDAPQDRENNSMITSKGNDSGKSPSLQCRALLVRSGVRCSGQNSIVAIFNLLDCPSVVIPINKVRNLGPQPIPRGVQKHTKSQEYPHNPRP